MVNSRRRTDAGFSTMPAARPWNAPHAWMFWRSAESLKPDSVIEGKELLRDIVSMLFGLIRANSADRIYEEEGHYGSPLIHRRTPPMLETKNLKVGLRLHYRAARSEHLRPHRQHRHPHRRQWRGQIHHPPRHFRHREIRLRQHPFRGRGYHPSPPAQNRRARPLPRPRGPHDFPQSHRARKSRDGRLPAKGRPNLSARISTTSSPSSPGSRSGSARRPAPSPAASSRCSPSAARS